VLVSLPLRELPRQVPFVSLRLHVNPGIVEQKSYRVGVPSKAGEMKWSPMPTKRTC
jgi:hypothetical protein